MKDPVIVPSGITQVFYNYVDTACTIIIHDIPYTYRYDRQVLEEHLEVKCMSEVYTK